MYILLHLPCWIEVEDRVQALLAVDAWTGAYLDVDRDRLLLWPDGEPDADASESQPTIEALGHQPVSFISRILRFFGIGRSSDAEPDPEIRGMLDAMVSSFGAREGESGAFQIASLPRLIGELNEILAHEGIGANEESIRRALAEYENENRFDDDPHIQCRRRRCERRACVQLGHDELRVIGFHLHWQRYRHGRQGRYHQHHCRQWQQWCWWHGDGDGG